MDDFNENSWTEYETGICIDAIIGLHHDKCFRNHVGTTKYATCEGGGKAGGVEAVRRLFTLIDDAKVTQILQQLHLCVGKELNVVVNAKIAASQKEKEV